LESICAQVAQALKPDGLLFLNEYVGPSAFDFTPRQKEVIQAALHLIPPRFRRNFASPDMEIMQVAGLPSVEDVKRADPSESVRSAEIIPVVEAHFDVLTRNEMGGTMLQFLLSAIAGNFVTEEPDSMKVLQLLLTIEDTLLEIGDLTSDFAAVVAKPKAI
jgi:hypothetical protein